MGEVAEENEDEAKREEEEEEEEAVGLARGPEKGMSM